MPCSSLERGPRLCKCSDTLPERSEQERVVTDKSRTEMRFGSPDIQENLHNSTSCLKSAQSSHTSEEKKTNHFKGQPVPMAELVPGGSRERGPLSQGGSSPLRTTSSKGMSLNSLWYCWLYLLRSVCKTQELGLKSPRRAYHQRSLLQPPGNKTTGHGGPPGS